MTDLPRRSYPLVVPPPGGFEDAVRRGRRMRRRRAGGTSGIALVLAGALGWSVLGAGSGVDRIEPTREDRRERSSAPFGDPLIPTQAPQPSAPSNVRPGALPTTGPGSVRGTRPTAAPTAVVVSKPTRKPGGGTPSRAYARRAPIQREEPSANTWPECLSQQDLPWCSWADVDTTRAATEGIYTLSYWLCRQVNAGAGTLTFDYRQEVEFKATDKANNDTVWTYSAGQRRISEPETLVVPANSCIRWHVEWDGYDDFGYTPRAGTYSLYAKLLVREPEPQAAQRDFEHH